MIKYCSIYALMIFVFCSCKTAKNTGKTQPVKVNISDSFRTEDLFFLTPQKQLEDYQNIDHLLSTHIIKTAKEKYPLTGSLSDLSNFSFQYKDTLRTIDDFMKQTNVVGIMIVKNDTILLEQYREGTGPQTKWISFSVTKSITSLLYGAALKDGYIQSMDQKVPHFIPELAGGVYDSVSLHNLLQMSSGVKWNDDTRDPNSDLFKIGKIEKTYGWRAVMDTLSHLKRAAPPGKRFNYNTIESILAGLILKNVIKKSLSEYLSEKIWKPFGMHADANWVTIRALDVENGGCCISATLQDYALLGLFALKSGITLNGEQAIKNDWIEKSTLPTSSYKGYGYFWWLHPKNKRYFASGAFGQQIEIDPSQNAVIAIQSYWPVAFDDYYIDYLDGFIEAMMNKLQKKN